MSCSAPFVLRSCIFSGLWSLWLTLPCCDSLTSCDEGEVLQDGMCLPHNAADGSANDGSVSSDVGGIDDTGGGGAGGSAAAAEARFDCTGVADTGIRFGDACSDGSTHSECGCPAPVCAAQLGVCTQINCDRDAGTCPQGWQCADLSALDPSYPHTCLPN